MTSPPQRHGRLSTIVVLIVSLLLCIEMPVGQCLTVPHRHIPALMAKGGGRKSQEERELDEYIEKLVADVDTEGEELEKEVEEEEAIMETTSTSTDDAPTATIGRQTDKATAAAISDAPADLDLEPDVPVSNKVTTEQQQQPQSTDSVEATVEEQDTTDIDTNSTSTPAAQPESLQESDPCSSDSDQRLRQSSNKPPNALYRILLANRRMGGHVVVMCFVWIAEFIQTYLPPLANLWTTLMTLLFGAASSRRTVEYDYHDDDSFTAQNGYQVNDQYAAFVSKRAMRGKDRKKVSERADEEAADQLQRVGRGARHKHLSVTFMQRHGIGVYAPDRRQTTAMSGDVRNDSGEIELRNDKEVAMNDEDEDVDWVVEALIADEPTSSTKKSIKPTLEMGVSNTGVTVGIGFQIGGTSSNNTSKRKKKRRSTLIAAATSTSPEENVLFLRKSKVRSDREGGMLGRMRDFGTNNVMSRSLFGAYPGDALPPSEAANARGLVDLASSKYGYGEWSDDEDDNENDGTRRTAAKRRKKRRPTVVSSRSSSGRSSSASKGQKRRPKPSSSLSNNLSVKLDMNSSAVKKTPVSERDTSSPPPKKKRTSKMVRLPMERLSEGKSVLGTRDDE